MYNFLKVAVFDTRYNLMKEVSCFIGREAPFGYNIVEEFATGYVFIDKEDVCGRVDDFVEADDMWMCTEVQNINFALDLFFHAELFDFCLIQDLDCYFVPRYRMCGKLDLKVVI